MIGNQVEATVEIEGTRPLWWHAFHPDALSTERQEKGGVPGNDPSEWQKTVLYDPGTRKLYIPDTYLFGSIRDGSKYTKIGRSSYLTRVTATVRVLDEKVWIDRSLPAEPGYDTSQPVYIDVRATVNPKTRGKNIRYRIATAAGWCCQFRLSWDRTVISKGIIRSILNDSGSMVGVGSGRAIGMGRYIVRSFTVVSGNDRSEE